jgi:hypothetical protein
MPGSHPALEILEELKSLHADLKSSSQLPSYLILGVVLIKFHLDYDSLLDVKFLEQLPIPGEWHVIISPENRKQLRYLVQLPIHEDTTEH